MCGAPSLSGPSATDQQTRGARRKPPVPHPHTVRRRGEQPTPPAAGQDHTAPNASMRSDCSAQVLLLFYCYSRLNTN
eukprot:COSAG02_NODE_139_length_34376_cov_233.853663_24_plen_77_part_00